MKLIRTEDAVGHVLCHDMTQIIRDQYKDARFRKGHIVTEEDIPVLLSMGKEHLYVWEMNENMVHENDAAERLLALCGQENMARSEVKEGKIELKADASALSSLQQKLEGINFDDFVKDAELDKMVKDLGYQTAEDVKALIPEGMSTEDVKNIFDAQIKAL